MRFLNILQQRGDSLAIQKKDWGKMVTENELDRIYPRLRYGRKCINPNCRNYAHHVHHIVGRTNKLLRHDVQNLIPLCTSCHADIHDKGLYHRGMDFIDENRQEYLSRMRNVSFKDYLLQNNLTEGDFLKLQKTNLLSAINSVSQNTPEWLEKKQSKIGASEIAAVVKSFVPFNDLAKILGEKTAHSFFDEPLFITGYAIYHKVACNYKLPPIDDELSLYGHAMEKYFDWLMQDDDTFSFEGSSDFIERPDISPYCVCSPDGYATAKKEIVDVNGRPIKGDSLVWEKKTVSLFKSKKEEMNVRGLPWQYIFQNQYQMMCCDAFGGVISSLVLVQDTPFIRGRLTSLCEVGDFTSIRDLFQPRVDHYVYAKIDSIQEVIRLALHNFEESVKKGTPPEINTTTGNLAEKDFKIYQTLYKGNPEGRKMATSQDIINVNDRDFILDEYLDDFLDMYNIIIDNNERDKLAKIIMKKYLYDNKLNEVYSGRGGCVKLSKNGSLIVRSNVE